MSRLLTIIITIASLTGCVTPVAIKDQLPKIYYTNNEKVLISVIDERRRVQQGKPEDFIGVAHGVFGIPADWHVGQVLATEEGDKERDLSDWLELRIVNGLNQEGWQSRAIDLNSLPDIDEATSRLVENDAPWLIALVLNEWYFSINLNWVTAFNFDTDTDIHVFHISSGKVLSKSFKERDVIEEMADESPQNNILGAYRAQIQQIFNDEALQNVLGKKGN
jgi:hypothetical protein